MSTPAIKKALTIEEIFAQSDRERRLYELREKGLHDLATIRATGREEGREERNREIARALLVDGLAPEQVARVTGLSLDEVKALGGHSVQENSAKYAADKTGAHKPRRKKRQE